MTEAATSTLRGSVSSDSSPGSVQQPPALRCVLETSFEALEHLQSVWDAAVAREGSTIYLTFDWVRTWWQFYGAGKSLRIFLFYKGEEPVAALPIYLENFGVGPAKTIVARLVGANLPPKTFNPPVRPEFARQVFAHVLRQLFKEDRCSLLSLGPVSEKWAASEHLPAAAMEAGLSASYKQRDVQTFFRLPSDFNQYLAELSDSERKHRLKRLRRLEKSYTVTADVVSDPTLAEREFESFVAQHSRQWQAIGRGGHFAAWPHGEEYNRAQVKAQAGRGRVRFFRMLANGQVIANRYTFLLGSMLFSELPSREVGEPWDNLGIGAISLLKFNESAIAAGVTAVDSGLGDYEHKTALGGDRIPVGIWRVAGRGVQGFKADLFLGVSALVLLLGHKLWYRRLLPRMPKQFKRTQLLGWLRFDA